MYEKEVKQWVAKLVEIVSDDEGKDLSDLIDNLVEHTINNSKAKEIITYILQFWKE